MVLENTLESPFDSKEIKPVNPKGNQPWIFIGKTNAEAEALILWPPDTKNQLLGKDTDAGKYQKREEKGMTEDEMIGWHHWFKGHEFGQTPGDSEGQETWCAAVHGVTKSQTWLSDWTATTTSLKALSSNTVTFWGTGNWNFNFWILMDSIQPIRTVFSIWTFLVEILSL